MQKFNYSWNHSQRDSTIIFIHSNREWFHIIHTRIHEFDNVEGFYLEGTQISCNLNSLLEATSVINKNKFYMYYGQNSMILFEGCKHNESILNRAPTLLEMLHKKNGNFKH